MNKTLRQLILSAGILTSGQLFALGLGNLQVDSALDEVLSGQIPLVADSNEELTGLKVSLATDSDYKKVGLDKSYVPSNIKVALSENGKFVELTSVGPVNEPIVSLLLVVDWANGHLLREYTILLDPPLFNNTQMEQNYSDPVKTQTYSQPDINESDNSNDSEDNSVQNDYESDKTSQNAGLISDTTYNSAADESVTVETGDTLWSIANRYNRGYGSPHQMMVAIFNNNPMAFSNNDMNMLKKGAVLEIPEADEVTMISRSDALSEVKSQTANVSRLQTADDYATDDSSGSDVDYGIELVPPSSEDSVNSGNTSGSALQKSYERALADLALAREELASSNQENEELASRVAELEQIVADQKMAMSLKDDDLAQLQQQLQQQDSGEDDVWDNTQATISDVENDKIDEQIQEVIDSGSENDNANQNSTDLAVNNQNNTEDKADEETIQISNIDKKNTPEVKQQTPPVQQPKQKSFMDTVMEYKFEGLIGLGVILASVFGFMFLRRKKVETIDLSQDESMVVNMDNDQEELTLAGDAEENETDGAFDDLGIDSDEEAPEVVIMDEVEDEQSDTDDLDLSGLDDISLDELDSTPELDNDDFSGDISNNEEDIDHLEMNEVESDETELSEEFDLESDLDNIDELDLDTVDEESKEESEDDMSFDFDVSDFDDLQLEDDSATEETESNEAESIESADLESSDDEEDFTLDFDLEDTEDLQLDDNEDTEPESNEVETIEDSASEDGESDNEDLDLGDLEFDLGDDFSGLSNDSQDDADLLEENISDINMEEFDFDDIGIESDNDLETESSDNQEEENISENMQEDNATENEEEDMSSDDFDLGLDFAGIGMDSNDAIDTKLDLAKAYFEMGDMEGAKQMISEIIDEGNEDQVARAEELKSKLG